MGSDTDLKGRLRRELLPASGWREEAGAMRSDFDLNPDTERPARTLRPAAVLVPIIAQTHGASVLLTRRADTLTSHTGQIAFPGGRLDPGETAVEAALREASEEVGLDPAAVEVLGLSEAYETGTGFLISPVIGWIDRPPTIQAQAAEVADIFEVPWDFLMDPANHRRESMNSPFGKRWFWAMPYGDRYIWGATAGILRALSVRWGATVPADGE
ncbi:CoA pyrophosphatase [soil metagenome]